MPACMSILHTHVGGQKKVSSLLKLVIADSCKVCCLTAAGNQREQQVMVTLSLLSSFLFQSEH